MKKTDLSLSLLLLAVLSISASGCEVVGGIFKAGVWFGILGIVVVVVIIFWLLGKARK